MFYILTILKHSLLIESHVLGAWHRKALPSSEEIDQTIINTPSPSAILLCKVFGVNPIINTMTDVFAQERLAIKSKFAEYPLYSKIRRMPEAWLTVSQTRNLTIKIAISPSALKVSKCCPNPLLHWRVTAIDWPSEKSYHQRLAFKRHITESNNLLTKEPSSK
jgi:hypothetical protein